MSGLVFDYQATELRNTHDRWKFVKAPYFVYTDYPWQTDAAIWDANLGFIADYKRQCIYPKPVSVYFDQASGYYYKGNGAGTLAWTNLGSVPFTYRPNNPHLYQEFHVQQDPTSADGGLFWAETTVDTQGVTFLWSRNDQLDADSTIPDVEKFTAFRVGVGTGPDLVIYSVRYYGMGDVLISKSIDGGNTFQPIEPLRQKADYGAAYGHGDDDAYEDFINGESFEGDELPAPYDMNYLEFRLLAGRLSVWVGPSNEYVYDEHRVDSHGNPIVTISQLDIRAYKFTAFAASAHLTKWTPSVEYISPEIPIGFSNTNHPNPPYVDPAGPVPGGWSATLDPGSSLDGPIVTYGLIVSGPVNGTYKGFPYSDYTPCVRAVNLFWDAIVDYTGPSNPAPGIAPESVEVAYEFDINTLEVTAGGSAVYNNNRQRLLPNGATGTWGQWLNASGQGAADIYMGRTTSLGGVAGVKVMTAYANTKGQIQARSDGSYYTMMFSDRSVQLKSPRWGLPWMDGWNVFYAMFFLAELGGVHPDDMWFLPWVPSVPFGPGSDLGSPDGSPAYYLPVGDAGSVISRPQSGVPLWETMKKIAFSIGYLLFFNTQGQLYFNKFTFPNGIKRTFFESDRESALGQVGGGLEGCWEAEVVKDMGEVRTTSMVIGINAFGPRYDPIVYKYTDDAAINDPTVFNHLGYDNPSVWMDSQFADPYFAYQAAQAMYYFLRTPGYGVSFETWLQPDIFPLDMIAFTSPKLGTTGLRYMVMGVKHRVVKDRGSSVIRARFLP